MATFDRGVQVTQQQCPLVALQIHRQPLQPADSATCRYERARAQSRSTVRKVHAERRRDLVVVQAIVVTSLHHLRHARVNAGQHLPGVVHAHEFGVRGKSLAQVNSEGQVRRRATVALGPALACQVNQHGAHGTCRMGRETRLAGEAEPC